MKLIVTVVVLFAIVAFSKAESSNKKVPVFVKSFDKLHRRPPKKLVARRTSVETKWITQNLDHFDIEDTRTWQMRYVVNEEHFGSGGPMFISLGGEEEISPEDIQNGIFHDLAKEHKGILFHTEHRYYGESKPTSNLTVENLKYLSVKQALADLAHFIRTQRETDSRLANSKVIICGGSYSATMVVWFSKLYPELVNGGWASSAPLLAKVDFKEYLEVTGKSFLELGSQQCYDRIKNGIAELENMFAGNQSAEAKAMLQLCGYFDHTNELDLWTLFATISNIFSGIVHYQREGDIPYHCANLTSFEDDLTAIKSYFLSSSPYVQGCIDATYEDSLNYYMNISYQPGPSRPWFYQTCSGFGWYQTSTSCNQPFGTKFPVTLYTTLCYDVFGSNYTSEHIYELVAETNNVFGGLNPEVKNVYMTHGALDPWSVVGQNEADGATVIPRTSHCADFDSITDSDSPEMRASKELFAELVREWLA